jgi:hypothetical protein
VHVADPEAEPAAPGKADEVGALHAEVIQHRDRIGHADRHRVRLHVVRLLAPPKPPVVDEDPAELVRGQRPRDRRSTLHR